MIVALDMNKKMLIQDSIKKLNFYVTLMDAKQKPGAVMFLFEGEQTELSVCSYVQSNSLVRIPGVWAGLTVCLPSHAIVL